MPKKLLTPARLFRIFIEKLHLLLPGWITRSLQDLSDRLYYFFKRRVVAEQRQALEALLAARPAGQPVIFFAPSLTWDTQLFQRPQQLALALAQQGALVLYLGLKPDLKQAPFTALAPNLYLANIFLPACGGVPAPLVYVLTWNTRYLAAFNRPRVIYDYVDDIDVFYGNTRQLLKTHAGLLRSAALVLVTARKLLQKAAAVRPDAILCPNAVDTAHFSAPPAPPPPDLAPILAGGRPIIGYYGALARWFDYALVRRLAELRPDLAFVLIGPNYDGTLKDSWLVDRPNLFWLGVKPYAELPAYLNCFAAAMIPFVVNEITHSTSPLKLFEYMAGGKSVVVTPMHESLLYPGVLSAATPEEFSARIDEALRLKDDPAYRQTIAGVARQNTWQARAAAILAALGPLK